jgi:hypothetical protein
MDPPVAAGVQLQRFRAAVSLQLDRPIIRAARRREPCAHLGSSAVSVTTTSRTLAVARSGGKISSGWWAIAMFGFVILPATARRRRRSLRLLPLVLLFMCSCGGNNSGGQQTNTNGTPAGSYTLTLSANSGSTSQSMPLTLNVQ